MQVSSPFSMVNGHGPSVHVAALTALDFGVSALSAVGVTTSGDPQPANGNNTSPTAKARSASVTLESQLLESIGKDRNPRDPQ